MTGGTCEKLKTRLFGETFDNLLVIKVAKISEFENSVKFFDNIHLVVLFVYFVLLVCMDAILYRKETVFILLTNKHNLGLLVSKLKPILENPIQS